MAPRTRQTLDAHLHVWERAKHPQPWIDPETMAGIDKDFPPASAVDELGRSGVGGCIVVQAVNEIEETADLLADGNPGLGEDVPVRPSRCGDGAGMGADRTRSSGGGAPGSRSAP